MILYRAENKIAIQVGAQMIPVDGVTQNELPLGLFGLPNEKPHAINILEFMRWCADRCFPRDRMDRDEILEAMGLSSYNQIDIVERTGAMLTCKDPYWVDFETENSIHEWIPDRWIIKRNIKESHE